MKKRSLAALFVCAVLLAPAFAGDVATFVNLGFSADSEYFMFGQYGIDLRTGTPYAETFLVNNGKNDFVPQGVTRKSFPALLEAGQEVAGAFYTLYAEQIPLVKKYRIDHLRTGRLLYVLMDGQEPPAMLSFRDFKTGALYEVTLEQKAIEAAGSVQSSFGLSLRITEKDGRIRRASGGNPGIRRSAVKSYVIRRIIIAPDERTLVLIVEKRMLEKGEGGIRYMIEAVKLP